MAVSTDDVNLLMATHVKVGYIILKNHVSAWRKSAGNWCTDIGQNITAESH